MEILIAREGGRLRLQVVDDGQAPPGDSIDRIDVSAAPQAATDDWPFLYLRTPFIAPASVRVTAVVQLSPASALHSSATVTGAADAGSPSGSGLVKVAPTLRHALSRSRSPAGRSSPR